MLGRTATDSFLESYPLDIVWDGRQTNCWFGIAERLAQPTWRLVARSCKGLCLPRLREDHGTNGPAKRMMEPADDQLKVGLFGIGLDTYWPQFPGLRDKLTGFTAQVARKLENSRVRVINLGLIDTPEKSLAAGHEFRKADVDLIFLYVTTYALSSTVLPAVRRARVPVIVLNLSPTPAIDYDKFNRLADRTKMTAEWLAYCQACPVPEIANVFNRSRIPFFQVTGMLENDPVAWNEIAEWIEAARVAHVMEHNRLGVMGNYYGGMLDIYSDLTQQCSYFGGHIEILEVEELAALRREVNEADLSRRVKEFRSLFDVQADCSTEELQRAARTSVALDQLVEAHRLGSLAYYHKGVGSPENEDAISSVILGTSLLTARGIPVAGEYEIKNAQAMKIMDSFGAGGSFTEYYAVDYNDDVVLMGHDGPGHIAIAQGKTKVRPLEVYHGKVGRGLSVEMSVKHGAVTLLSVVQTADGKLKLLVAEGDSVPGPILEIGNTNSRYQFPIGARNFLNEWNVHGPAHHCAVGVGHISSKLKKLGALLGMECVRVS
jgi:L-arabinose isomerase